MPEKARSITIMGYRAGRVMVVVMTAAIMAIGIVIICGSSAQRAKAATHGQGDFAILSAGAQAESAVGRDIPVGAIFAGTSNADGQVNRLYAWERVVGEYCLLDLEGPEARSVVCGQQAKVELSGLLLAEESDKYAGTNVIGLVPNGVKVVTFTDSDGSTHTVAVSNNVVDYANSGGVTKASFDLPGGSRNETAFAG